MRTWLGWALMALALVSLPTAMAVANLCWAVRPVAIVVVHSEPEGATVFGENAVIGFTPVRVHLAKGERRTLRLLKKDYGDGEICLEADSFLPSGPLARVRWLTAPKENAVTVLLQPVASARASLARLAVSTDPVGAEVFLDGRRLGPSPVSLGGLAPGAYLVRLVHPEFLPHEEKLILEAGKETHIRRSLESKVVALYRELIRREPGNLNHYTELAHYHVLNGQFKEAAAALRAGMVAIVRPDATQQARYLAELIHIYTRYYKYPDETPDNKIRPVCREIMQTMYDQRIGNVKQLETYLKQMDAYDGIRQQAK